VSLKILIWMSIIGLGIGLLAAVLFAIANGSQRIGTAAIAVMGSSLAFGYCVWSDLHSSEEKSAISAEFTIDRTKPSIGQSFYSEGNPRQSYEDDASVWLAKNAPNVFRDDARGLAIELAIKETLLFFIQREPDWQMVRRTLASTSNGTVETATRVSNGSQCYEIDQKHLAHLLRKAGVHLSGFALSTPYDSICLPKGSRIDVLTNALIIENDFGSVSFEFKSEVASQMAPRSNGEVPLLVDGHSRFETRFVNIDVVNTTFALYSQHRDSRKHEQWRRRVVAGVGEWFKHLPDGGMPHASRTQ
jgi:hypothetical protein